MGRRSKGKQSTPRWSGVVAAPRAPARRPPVPTTALLSRLSGDMLHAVFQFLAAREAGRAAQTCKALKVCVVSLNFPNGTTVTQCLPPGPHPSPQSRATLPTTVRPAV
jgi:hypothetical protein